MCDLKAGAETFDLNDLPIMNENNMYAITAGSGRYINTMGHASCLTNHSCNPTVYFDQTSLKFFTTLDVKQGEMLTFDYTITEVDISAPFTCCCGATNCKGQISTDK